MVSSLHCVAYTLYSIHFFEKIKKNIFTRVCWPHPGFQLSSPRGTEDADFDFGSGFERIAGCLRIESAHQP